MRIIIILTIILAYSRIIMGSCGPPPNSPVNRSSVQVEEINEIENGTKTNEKIVDFLTALKEYLNDKSAMYLVNINKSDCEESSAGIYPVWRCSVELKIDETLMGTLQKGGIIKTNISFTDNIYIVESLKYKTFLYASNTSHAYPVSGGCYAPVNAYIIENDHVYNNSVSAEYKFEWRELWEKIEDEWVTGVENISKSPAHLIFKYRFLDKINFHGTYYNVNGEKLYQSKR